MAHEMTGDPLTIEPATAHQFETADQQRRASVFGMWVFLLTEVMFFGGLILLYTAYRYQFSDVFAAASNYCKIPYGGTNTAILLGSSLTIALADVAAKRRKRVYLILLLGLTAVLGAAFLGVKFYEYAEKIHEHLLPGGNFAAAGFLPKDQHTAEMFFYLYFAMTGLHAIHLTIGVLLVGCLAIWAIFSKSLSSGHDTVLENVALYWHFVDVIWVFLFPLFYLVS